MTPIMHTAAIRRLLTLFLLAMLLIACGQKGPLIKPEQAEASHAGV